jgi:DNA-binding transcriptional ArsR family regulator
MRSVPSKLTQARLHDWSIDGVESDTVPYLARFFGALAEPTRLKLLLAIDAAGKLGATECVKASGLSQGRTSVHLGCLAACGLIAVERVGRRKYYRIADPLIPNILQLASLHAKDNIASIAQCQRVHSTAS